MKGSSLPIPARDVAVADAVTAERSRAIVRAIDEIYFSSVIAPGVATYFATAAEVVNGNAWVMRFPVGAGGSASRTTSTLALWPNTRLRFTVVYTSPVGNTATFNLRGVFWTFGPGVGTGVAAGSRVVAWTAPGPAVANDFLTTSAVITGARFGSTPLGGCRLMLQRFPVADANPNDLDVLLARVTFEEVA